jgi:hypothetical protein
MKTILSALTASLSSHISTVPMLNAVAGFDGFIDEMISVVGERSGVDRWTAMASMAELGNLVTAAAGHNSLREIVVRSQDAGGCAVNLADGLTALGVPLDYFGTLGSPRHPSFEPFAGTCRSCTSWGTSYGRTLAFEFKDGKFMFSAVSQLGEIDAALVGKELVDGAYLRACQKAKLVAITNWTLYPHMTACWELLQKQVFDRLTHRPWLFIDLVDPSSRSETDIRAMLASLRGFERGCATVLGVNYNESSILARLLGLPAIDKHPDALATRAAALRQALGISRVVIHSVQWNVCADERGSVQTAAGPYCAEPKKTTGAGDRFNAGFCFGLMLGLDANHCLTLGSAASGYFVRHARSATFTELQQFLTWWSLQL